MRREWHVAAGRDRPFRARHDGRHQRRARTQGRAHRPDHDRRVQGRARDRPPDAARDVRPRAQAGDAGVPRARSASARRCPSASAAAGRGAGRRSTRRAVAQAVGELAAEGVEAIAVCYLFSFLNPAHERRTREIIADLHPELMVSLSCEVDPAFREYERTCVTAFDAYVKPVVGRYLESHGAAISRGPASARRCRSCSRAAASARPPSRGSGRCGCSCRVPRPA